MGKNSSKSWPQLSFQQLVHGYQATLDNGMRSAFAAIELANSYPDKALALAQIGQEELGKNLMLLAAFSLSKPDGWQWFWSGWRNHDLKASRAHMFEIVCPSRIEFTTPEGEHYNGLSKRERPSLEKEIGLYVDYDERSGVFTCPASSIQKHEQYGRITAVIYLCLTADAVRRTLTHRNEEFRFPAFGNLAFRFCTEHIYQQHWPALLQQFRNTSQDHELLARDLEISLEGNAKFYNDTFKVKNGVLPISISSP